LKTENERIEEVSMAKSVFIKRQSSSEKEISFERERLLNLIESKVKRNEMDLARGLAEDLFKTEMEFALSVRTKILGKHNRILLKIMLSLISIVLACTAFMVLNIKPSFSLLVQGVTVIALLSTVAIDTLLVRRFERALKTIMEVYETQKQSFIEGVITNGIHYTVPLR
jgi:hypothetical protein